MTPVSGALLAAAAAALGAALGLGGFTFIYAKGASYLSTDPAGCADCHMPHDIVGKYAAKASNGFWHSLAFTTGRFPDPLQIKPHNRAITEGACRECHADVVAAIDPVKSREPIGIQSGI